MIISYIVIATVIVISYNLFLNQFLANKFYISTIIIGTTLTVILYGFLIKLDTHHTTNEEINKSKRLTLQSIIQDFELLQGKFERAIKSKNIIEKNQSGFANSMEKLTTKLKYLPPSATENNNFLSTIQNYEQDLKQLIKKLETSESESAKEVKENIDNTVSAVVSEIEILRKSFKS